MSLQIASASFSPGGSIPKKFTCDGPDTSPQLSWKDAPAQTQTFALIVDDPDAPVGTWVHWVLYNLPANSKELTEGVEKQEQLSNGALQGRNDFRKIGYGGPCPPPDKIKQFAGARPKPSSRSWARGWCARGAPHMSAAAWAHRT